MTPAQNAHWKRLIGAVLGVLAGAYALPHLLDPPELQENRTLADLPAWPTTLGGLTAYRQAMDAYVADHFPPRTHLIGYLNALRAAVGVSGSPRVIVGHRGWLFSDNGSHLGAARGDHTLTNAQARDWLYGLAARTEALRAEGRTYIVLSPPVKEAIYPGNAPDWFDLDFNRDAATLQRLASASDAGALVYPNEAIARPARWGLHVYDRYDSHWTGLGAYHGYAAFMQALQRLGVAEGPRPIESFMDVAPDERANEPRDLALMLGISSFGDVNYPRLDDPGAAPTLRIIYPDGGETWRDLRVIDTGQAGKPVLLMTVDSFSNALMPFLYGHFSRIVTVHNERGVWRRDLIDRFQPDIVALEVLESGLDIAMKDAPRPTADVQARIVTAVAERRQHAILPPTSAYRGKRREIEGTAGNDRLRGSRRAETIQGRPGDDTIDGLGGDDVLRGGRGRDVVNGGAGRDWVSGGRDDDTLSGGRDADVFDIFPDAGTDAVLDFRPEEGDRVEIERGAAFTVRQVGPDVVIELRNARLVLRNVQQIDIPPDAIRNR